MEVKRWQDCHLEWLTKTNFSYERKAVAQNMRSRKNEYLLCLICRHSLFREPSVLPLVRWPNSVCHYKEKAVGNLINVMVLNLGDRSKT